MISPLENIKVQLSEYGHVEIKRPAERKFVIKVKLFDRCGGEMLCDNLAQYFLPLGIRPTIGLNKYYLTCEWEI